MIIKSIEYGKTASIGNYTTERLYATAELEEGESPEQALTELQTWVDDRLNLKKEVQDLGKQRLELTDQLKELQRNIGDAEVKWNKTKAFLEKHGVDPSQYDDIPF
jgi:predicted  nucleic acid-binding Zn-ribbon protein